MKKNLIYLSALFFALFVFSNERTTAQAWKLTGNNLTGSEKLGSLNNFDLNFITNNIKRMTIKGNAGNGNVGIGTSAPAAQLHIAYNSSTANPQLLLEETQSDYARINFKNTNTTNFFSIAVLPASTTAASKFNFYYSPTGNVMTLQGDGKVGIGTDAPDAKLSVVGTSHFVGNVGINRSPQASRDLALGVSIQIGSVESLIDGGSDLLTCSASFAPTSDNSSSLGNSNSRWSAVWAADGTINTSDLRDKKNIRDLDYGLSKLMQLHPVRFNWKEGINTSDKVGLIAQELQKVLPEVVRDYDIKTDEATGRQEKVPAARLGVMYTDLIPVLIKSIQELEMQVAELKKQVNDKTFITSSASDEGKITKAAANAILEQNTPNPFNSNTTIRYTIPASVSKAQIMITNANGNVIKTFILNNKGAGSLTIKAGELTAGTYYYTLVVDGQKTDSKQMVLIK